MRIVYGVVMMLALALVAPAAAQSKHIKKSDLPAAVQKTADEQTKGGTVRSYSSEVEDGKLEYEVALTVNGRSRDVSIAPDGSLLEIEEEVPIDKLPADVSAALKRKAGAGTLGKVESLTKHGKIVAYEAHVTTKGKKSEVQVGPDGKDLARPE